MTTRVLGAIGLLFLTGCATPSVLTSLPTTHPGSAGGEVAAPPPPSDTLSVAMADPVLPGRAARPVADHSGHETKGGDGHEMHGAAAAAAESPGADAPAALYVCPMHKDVTATNPNDRCPKCKMKINKRVKAKPAAQADEHAGHGAHGGQK